MRTTSLLLLLGLFSLAPGCDNPDPEVQDLSIHDVAVTNDQSQCSALTVSSAPQVEIEIASVGPSAATGGTIADGTYFATSVKFNQAGVADGGTVGTTKIAWKVQGSTLQIADDKSGPASATFSTSGTKLNVVDTCPDTNTTSFDYSASATTLVVSRSSNGATTTITFTKQ